MKVIDFMSRPPANKFAIFSQGRNKTNFGAVIFLIEIIAIILITFIFLFDYRTNANYTIEYSYFFETNAGVYNNPDSRFDQKKKFNFQLYTDYGNELSDNFEISTYDVQEYHKTDYRENGVEQNPSKLKLAIYYKCHNKTICKYFEKGNQDKDYTREYYKFQINYPSFVINHESPTPLRDLNGEMSITCPFLFDTITYTKLHWKNVKYEENTGMWSRLFNQYVLGNEPTSYVGGFVESISTFPLEIDERWIYTFDKKHKLLAIIEIDNNILSYYHYKRTANSIFTTIANIAALISTVNFILVQFLMFYSSNYDNYKIIRYITSIKNSPDENLNKNSNTEGIKEIDNEIDIDNKNNADTPLINGEKEENDLIIGEVGKDLENKIDKNHEKINFLQFFLNNVYFKCCKKTREQEIINICNEIISKYLSINNILLNQILFENLLKDYKWNNPSLNDIGKNELITKFNDIV